MKIHRSARGRARDRRDCWRSHRRPSGADDFDVHPGESIQAALDAAQPGASVHVAPGTLPGQPRTSRSR